MRATPGLLCLCACLALRTAFARPSPPSWPTSYEVQYTISLPYVSSVQPTPLRYPVHIWYNQSANLMRTSFYDGLDDTYITPDATFNLYPRILKRTCLVINTQGGPTAGSHGLLGEEGLPPPLPDISGWDYAGAGHLPGKGPTHVWQMTLRAMEKVATYTFHTAQHDGQPVHLDMLGVNLLTGSHFDQYTVEFQLFMPLMSARAFRPPEALCKGAADLPKQLGHMVLGQALSVLPGVMVPSRSPAAGTRGTSHMTGMGAVLQGWFSHLISRATGSASEGPAQAAAGADTSQVVTDNLQFIEQWNRKVQQGMIPRADPDVSDHVGVTMTVSNGSPVAAEDVCTLEANKFLSWTDKRWHSTVMGHVPQPASDTVDRSSASRAHARRSSARLGTFQRRLRNDQLPASVDWRGTGADGPVKDQASCGSCWTFAATGAMTGAWYVATNQSLSFSEQQLVDCSWDYQCPDSFCGGCWGGNIEPALQYVSDHGGIALEAAYPYRGQNGMCRENTTAKSPLFKGFLSVPSKDEAALMEAVATQGPLGISFDAVHPTFKFYSEGVYYREDCGQDEDHLNHAVTLVGYGTTPGGTDYWLLRNSWSQFWGDGGYFKMARKGNDCGVTVDPVIAVVDEAAAAKARKDNTDRQWKAAAATATAAS